MAMTGGGRTIVAGAIGLALVLGAGVARAEVAVDSCELTVVLGAPQDARPWGSVEVLVTGASDSKSPECGKVARAAALRLMQSGENVYVRGFGSFVIKKLTPRARPKEPKVTRAE